MTGLWQVATLMLLFALGSCKKPVLEVTSETVPPIILATSIYDSLPAHAVKTLGLEALSGLKLVYRSGEQISYFHYRIDKHKLLHVLGELPFNAHARIADTYCRNISAVDLERPWDDLSALDPEMQISIDDPDIIVYQCSKPPFLHTVVARAESDQSGR